MNILDFFKPATKKTASKAKERLQIVVSHQRANNSIDFLPKLREELMAVISKYTKIDQDKIQVQLEHENDLSILELNIIVPSVEAAEIT